MLHFITSYQSKLSLQHYQYVLDYYIRQPNFNYPNNTNNNQTYFLTILRLYINHYNILENQHSSFEPANYFINYKHITKNLEINTKINENDIDDIVLDRKNFKVCKKCILK